ncbi:MAG: ornithine cyclodeaminase family protein [Chloroflexota bacterium]
MPTLLLDRNAVKHLISMPDVISLVEEAFRLWAEGKAAMPPKAYLPVARGDFRAMPAALPGCAGIKWVSVHPGNPSRNLPSVMAVIIYNDPETGYPMAVMEATIITAYRTGAASAIASKYLARQDSHTLGIIGAGSQAYTQILAHAGLFKLRAINVFDISKSAVDKLIEAFPGLSLRHCAIQEAAASDIVCTLTPSRSPIVKKEWIAPGTHINAVGADAAGKEELDPSILKTATVVVDDLRQASTGGEINVPVKQGIYTLGEVYGTLPEIVVGRKKGRVDNRQVTVFDSTGVAIEDIAVARSIFDKAQRKGGYPSIELV